MIQVPETSVRLITRERPVNRSPIMHQKWTDLLFLHWEYDPAIIAANLPKGLYCDTFNDKAYIGITPFFMEELRLKLMPNIPGFSTFLEMNVRTYVYDENGTPGIWFYSLDANQPLAVEGAKSFFFLPYFYAAMKAEKDRRGEIDYTVLRNGSDESLRSHFIYRAKGNVQTAEAESLEFFLAERYVLFSYANEANRVYSGKISHLPHPIFDAELKNWDDNILEVNGLPRQGRAPDHVMISANADVDIYTLERVK